MRKPRNTPTIPGPGSRPGGYVRAVMLVSAWHEGSRVGNPLLHRDDRPEMTARLSRSGMYFVPGGPLICNVPSVNLLVGKYFLG